MSELHDKQTLFAKSLPRLIDYAILKGYDVVGGEWQRDPRIAQLNAAAGKGISTSLHIECLAVDLKLFKDGTYLTQTPDYEFLGTYWEGLHPDFRWGGRFGDGNHFSVTYQGRK